MRADQERRTGPTSGRSVVLRVILAAASALLVILFSCSAALGATGSVSGKVTAAATHQPLAGIEVCAMSTALVALSESEEEEEAGPEPGSEQFGCTKTGAGGEYTLSGLGAGTFAVGYGNPPEGSLNYVTQ